MRNTHSFKMNLPEMSDPVDVRELNDNFLVIDDALMAGLCKKELTTNNMGSSDPASRKYGWAPWIEIYNGNEFDVVVIDRNAPDLPSGTINIEAGKTHRMFINGTYYMNFYVQDQHDVTFKWFTNAETRINEIEPSGGGGVSSVNVTGASGSHIESSGGPVTDTGTIELSISTGYSIPADNKQTAWDSKAADLKLEINSSTFVITAQLKDASGNLIGNERTIDLPLESVVVSGDYDEQTKKVILTLQNGSTIEFSVADLVSGLQTELNDTDNKLDPTYIAYDASHRAVSDTEKSTWNSKQNAISDLATIRSGAAAGATAVQPSEMQTALSAKQDTISDLATIRSGASAGATAVQPTTMSEALALKQDSLDNTQLAAVNSGIDSNKVGQISTNQTNILYTLEKVGKNDFNFSVWLEECGVSNGSKTVTDNSITLTATGSDCCTFPEAANYPVEARVPVSADETIVFSWNYSPLNSQSNDVVGIFGNGDYTSFRTASADAGTLEYTVPNGVTFVTIRVGVTISGNSATYSDMMISRKSVYDANPTYQQYSRPNYDLTYRQAEDRAALVEQVDEGAKNKLKLNKDAIKSLNSGGTWSEYVYTPTTAPNLTVTINDDGTVTLNGSTSSSLVTVALERKASSGFQGYVLSGSKANTKLVYQLAVSPYTIYATADGVGSAVIANYTDGSTIQLSIQIVANSTFSNTVITPMICTLADWKISQNFASYALPNTDLTRMVNDLQKKAVKVYTYHVNPNESDPEDAVTYLDDATGLTPAKMGASSFSYGSWANAWFLPRPCVLKFDGTVDYYLNPNDYSKKTDGTASTIDSSNSTGNVMLEFPKIWVKRVNDGNGARTVSIAPVNVDGTYKCWSNMNAEDKEVDHFYLPAYNGTIHSSKMRSLSGVTLDTTYAPNYTRAQEVTAATANNPTGKNLWYTETWADMCLVYDLLYLMGKSLDVQRTFGQGLSSGSETAMRAYVTGTHNAKGLFYGDVSGTSTAVKVLGMENLWGCRWHGVAGLINDNGTLKVKMTYGVADGSTTVGYNTTGSGYLTYGSTYGTAGYVKKMQADNTMGYKIIETAGTDATYYCDYYYVNNSQSNYALLGGHSDYGAYCGFYVYLCIGAAGTGWSFGGSLSCRPES